VDVKGVDMALAARKGLTYRKAIAKLLNRSVVSGLAQKFLQYQKGEEHVFKYSRTLIETALNTGFPNELPPKDVTSQGYELVADVRELDSFTVCTAKEPLA
jgi:hypothetical protein